MDLHPTLQGAFPTKAFCGVSLFSIEPSMSAAILFHARPHRILRPQTRCCARVNATLGAALTRGMVRSRSTLTPPLPGERFAVLRYAVNRRSEPPLV